jgi:hypothetical protein
MSSSIIKAFKVLDSVAFAQERKGCIGPVIAVVTKPLLTTHSTERRHVSISAGAH